MGRYLDLAKKACVGELTDDWRVWYEERAAIMEYDRNMPRTQAEAEALKNTIRQMQAEKTKNLK